MKAETYTWKYFFIVSTAHFVLIGFVFYFLHNSHKQPTLKIQKFVITPIFAEKATNASAQPKQATDQTALPSQANIATDPTQSEAAMPTTEDAQSDKLLQKLLKKVITENERQEQNKSKKQTTSALTKENKANYTSYTSKVYNQITSHWEAAPVKQKLNLNLIITVAKDGTLLNIKWEKKAKQQTTNLAIEDAIQKAAPFPPMPAALQKKDSITIHLQFTLYPK